MLCWLRRHNAAHTTAAVQTPLPPQPPRHNTTRRRTALSAPVVDEHLALRDPRLHDVLADLGVLRDAVVVEARALGRRPGARGCCRGGGAAGRVGACCRCGRDTGGAAAAAAATNAAAAAMPRCWLMPGQRRAPCGGWVLLQRVCQSQQRSAGGGGGDADARPPLHRVASSSSEAPTAAVIPHGRLHCVIGLQPVLEVLAARQKSEVVMGRRRSQQQHPWQQPIQHARFLFSRFYVVGVPYTTNNYDALNEYKSPFCIHQGLCMHHTSFECSRLLIRAARSSGAHHHARAVIRRSPSPAEPTSSTRRVLSRNS